MLVSPAEERATLVSRAAADFAALLDTEAIYEHMARLALPMLGEFALVFVPDPSGGMRPQQLIHRDPREERVLRESYAPTLLELRGSRGLHTAIMRKHAVIEPEDGHGGVAAELSQLGARAAVSMPLFGRDRLLAALCFLATGDARQAPPSFDDAAMALLEELARHAGIAADNARLYQEAQRAIRAREDLLAIVSHDLRNPLNSILLAAEHSLSNASEQYRRAFSVILRSAQRMRTQINDLVDAASIEAGQLATDIRSHSLQGLLREAHDIFEPQATQRGIVIACEALD